MYYADLFGLRSGSEGALILIVKIMVFIGDSNRPDRRRKSMANSSVITVRLPKEDRAKLIISSTKTGKSKSEVVREALELYYKNEKAG